MVDGCRIYHVPLYKTLVHPQNSRFYRVLEFQPGSKVSRLLLTRKLVVNGEATYLAQAAEWESMRDTRRGVPASSVDERADIEGHVKGSGTRNGAELGWSFPGVGHRTTEAVCGGAERVGSDAQPSHRGVCQR